jgi:uncharacterized protein (DUF736 family)
MSTIDDENSRLDEQILKLRQCKAEMASMFEQLDNLERQLSDDDNSYSNDFNRRHSQKKYLSKSANYPKIYYNDELSFSHSSCDSQSYDDENDESFNYLEKRETTIISYEKPPRPVYKKKAKMQFSYKIPQNAFNTNSSLDLKRLVEEATRYNDSMKNAKKSPKPKIPKPPTSVKSSSSSHGHRRPQLSFLRPTWKPNGKKFNGNDIGYASQSLMFKSSKSRSLSTQSLNPSLVKPWKHTGKTRPDSAIFLSSTNLLTKSTESLGKTNNRKISQKDVGKEWRPVGYKKPDPSIYLSSHSLTNSSETPMVEKPHKKQPFHDEKDVGHGWKPIGIKLKSYVNIVNSVEPPTTLNAQQTKEVPKKKVIVDEKDVGQGWKHVGSKLKEDFKVFTMQQLDVDLVRKKKKDFKDEKDIGAGWKPVIKVKENDFVLKSSDAPKPVKPVAKNAAKAWKPSGISTKPPPMVVAAKTMPNKKLVQTNTLVKSKEPTSNNKNLITSTPNMSQDFEANKNGDHVLDESVIELKSEVMDNSKTLKKSNNNSNEQLQSHKRDEDLNEKLEDEDELINSIKNSRENSLKKTNENESDKTIFNANEINSSKNSKTPKDGTPPKTPQNDSLKNLSKTESDLIKSDGKINESFNNKEKCAMIEKPKDNNVFEHEDSDDEATRQTPKSNASKKEENVKKDEELEKSIDKKPKISEVKPTVKESEQNVSKPSSENKKDEDDDDDDDQEEEKQFWNMKSDEDD